MKIQRQFNSNTQEENFLVTVPEETMMTKLPMAIFEEVVKLVAREIADRVIEEKGQKIFESISPEAIANLTVAEAGRSIKEMLDKKLPDKIVEITKERVYQRGIFGGLTRIK